MNGIPFKERRPTTGAGENEGGIVGVFSSLSQLRFFVKWNMQMGERWNGGDER